MSEIGEIFKATKEIRAEESKQRREGNRRNSAKMLSDNGIKFMSKNGGIHLVVMGESMTADFWPSTGKFIIRGDSRRFRGVRLLIKIMRGDYSENEMKSLRGES